MSGFGRHHQPTQGCSECDAFEASVLLRDTPEDRERLRGIVRDVMNEWLTVEPDIVPDDEWDNEFDAIIAALKGV